MVKSKEQISKVSGEKTDNERLEGLDLDYMRKEIQKIIDNHLKGKPEWFSVEDWGARSLWLLIDLLTGVITWDELKERQKRNEKELRKTYDEILNVQDSVNALSNVEKDAGVDLSQLKADLSLGKDLDNL